MKIVGLDPGGTTGVAVYNDGEWTFDHIGPGDHHAHLFRLLLELDPTCVVCESFEYRQHVRANVVLVSKEYIGIAKLYSQRYRVPIFMQTAAQAKGFVKDENIKKLDLWQFGMRHAMDATRHVLYYMVNQLKDTDILKRGWK